MSTTESSAIPEVAAQAVDTHEKSPQESFAELRKAKEDLERQLWQAQKEREMYEKQMQMQQKPQTPPEEDFDYRQLENEEYPDGKRVVKALNMLERKMSGYDKKLAEKNQEIQILQTAQEFADFKEIVTAENIEKYIKSDEDNREAVEKATNPLRKVYNLIKKDARYQADQAKVKKDRPISQEQQRVDEKENKPKLSSLGVRSEAVSTAAAITSNSRMSKEQRNALWAETMAAARK
jgi:hypothetical protein